jgi:hypothetical protein
MKNRVAVSEFSQYFKNPPDKRNSESNYPFDILPHLIFLLAHSMAHCLISRTLSKAPYFDDILDFFNFNI